MIAHIDLYQEVEYIVEMNLQELKNKSTNELAEFKTQLKNVFRRIKTDRERFDKTKSFYRNSGYKMNDLQEKIDEIKEVIRYKKKIEDSSKKPKYEYFIIADLLATNKIEIQEKKIFLYKEIKYEYGAELSEIINNEFGTKNKAFTQYLNDFRSQAGEKYFLKIFDNDNNLDEKNIRILKKLSKHFSKEKTEVINKDFISVFKILKNKNLI
ncbi:MAG: hypothetical protein P8P00_09785 [Polaribacter sp.]|mgnify:CR=1 FL=1|nr:hypothetical protein [Polaribacter sp.]